MRPTLGVIMTAASVKLVGVSVSDPVTLIGHIQSPVWVAVAMALIIVATLSTNTAANIVSPTNDLPEYRAQADQPHHGGGSSPAWSGWR